MNQKKTFCKLPFSKCFQRPRFSTILNLPRTSAALVSGSSPRSAVLMCAKLCQRRTHKKRGESPADPRSAHNETHCFAIFSAPKSAVMADWAPSVVAAGYHHCCHNVSLICFATNLGYLGARSSFTHLPRVYLSVYQPATTPLPLPYTQ